VDAKHDYNKPYRHACYRQGRMHLDRDSLYRLLVVEDCITDARLNGHAYMFRCYVCMDCGATFRPNSDGLCPLCAARYRGE
jgi:rubrerythrin